MNIEDFGITFKSIRKMLRAARRDSDAVSFTTCGTSVESAEGAVIIVKGNDATRYIHRCLVGQGLLTADKPIIDPPGYNKAGVQNPKS